MDVNWKSYYGTAPDVSGFTNPEHPKDYSDVMKFSDCTNVYVRSKYVAAGKENAVDAVRGRDYVFSDCAFANGAGVATATVKGSIDGWAFEECFIGKAKSGTDIEVGQYDDYWHPGRPPTRNGRIHDCQTVDGTPITVTLWDATAPSVVRTHVKIRRIPKLLWFPYFLFRRWQRRRQRA
jgi:hypothetical protein